MKSKLSKEKKLVICGTGETAVLALEYFTKDSSYEVCAFAVNKKFKKSSSFLGLPVVEIEEIDQAYPASEFSAFVAVSSVRLNRNRAELYDYIKSKNYKLVSYISSRAFVWDNVEIGENCFILENNVLQPFTKIGDNVTMWSGNHIGHRSLVGDHVFISSHCVISGFCEIGKFSFLGVNSTLADKIILQDDNFISMGAVISKNTEKDGLYRGNPAKKHKLGAKRFCKVR
jgi:sugar O-acyltransferase (sialic acid O-acetyltransferase NeuD family)